MRSSSSTFCVLGDCPSTLTSPVLGVLIPASIRSRVDFPAPFGPTSAATRPGASGTSSPVVPSYARTVSRGRMSPQRPRALRMTPPHPSESSVRTESATRATIPSASNPAVRASSARRRASCEARPGAGRRAATGTSKTNVPLPGRPSTSPSSSKSRKARCTVFGLIAIWVTTSRTDGSRSPGSQQDLGVRLGGPGRPAGGRRDTGPGIQPKSDHRPLRGHVHNY